MIRKPLLVMALALFAISGISFAATHSLVGSWKLNTAKSDNGGIPMWKSAVVHISQDSSTAVAWRVRVVDDKGAVKHLSYSGTPGQAGPVKGGDGEQWSSSGNNGDGTFTVKESFPDGGSVTLNYTTSADGKTMTGTGTRTAKDGSSHPMTWVWNKVMMAH
jgi:hypothetical protein